MDTGSEITSVCSILFIMFANLKLVLRRYTSLYGIFITVSIHCAPEMSEIDCIGRIESFWPKFVRGW